MRLTFYSTELDRAAEGFVDLFVFLGVILGDFLEELDEAPGEDLFDLTEEFGVLEHFAGDVEGEVFGCGGLGISEWETVDLLGGGRTVNDGLEPAHPFWKRVFAEVVGDEYALVVDADIANVAAMSVPEVRGPVTL